MISLKAHAVLSDEMPNNTDSTVVSTMFVFDISKIREELFNLKSSNVSYTFGTFVWFQDWNKTQNKNKEFGVKVYSYSFLSNCIKKVFPHQKFQFHLLF